MAIDRNKDNDSKSNPSKTRIEETQYIGLGDFVLSRSKEPSLKNNLAIPEEKKTAHVDPHNFLEEKVSNSDLPLEKKANKVTSVNYPVEYFVKKERPKKLKPTTSPLKKMPRKPFPNPSRPKPSSSDFPSKEQENTITMPPEKFLAKPEKEKTHPQEVPKTQTLSPEDLLEIKKNKSNNESADDNTMVMSTGEFLQGTVKEEKKTEPTSEISQQSDTITMPTQEFLNETATTTNRGEQATVGMDPETFLQDPDNTPEIDKKIPEGSQGPSETHKVTFKQTPKKGVNFVRQSLKKAAQNHSPLHARRVRRKTSLFAAHLSDRKEAPAADSKKNEHPSEGPLSPENPLLGKTKKKPNAFLQAARRNATGRSPIFPLKPPTTRSRIQLPKSQATQIEKRVVEINKIAGYFKNIDYLIRKTALFYLQEKSASEIAQKFSAALVKLEQEVGQTNQQEFFRILKGKLLQNIGRIVVKGISAGKATTAMIDIDESILPERVCQLYYFPFRFFHIVNHNLIQEEEKARNFMEKLAKLLETEDFSCNVNKTCANKSCCANQGGECNLGQIFLNFCSPVREHGAICICTGRATLQKILEFIQYILEEEFIGFIKSECPDLELEQLVKEALKKMRQELQTSQDMAYMLIYDLLQNPIKEIANGCSSEKMWGNLEIKSEQLNLLLEHSHKLFYFFFRFLGLIVPQLFQAIPDEMQSAIQGNISEIISQHAFFPLEHLSAACDLEEIFQYCLENQLSGAESL